MNVAIIAICRGTKSGGTAMAECLAERLGYPSLGREVIQAAAVQLGVSAELLEQKMSGRPSLWSRFSAMRRAYIAAVQAALAERAAQGNLVYHGLAGGLLLRGAPATVCVRLIAPLEQRIQAVMSESEMDRATAERYILDVDQARARWVKAMYDEDIMDPGLYDLVIRLGPITVEGACAVVAKVVAQPEFALTDDVHTALHDFLTACRVRLALVSETELRALDLDVAVKGGVAEVTGEAPLLKTGRVGNRIVELAREVPGVEQVRLKVEWFDPYP